MSTALLRRFFEPRETRFTEQYLRPGMSVMDIGAHHGFYTLLACQKVGPAGRVISFEPSPRERRKLRWNVRVNRIKNVRIEPVALGSSECEIDLFVVNGKQTGFNSLRPPQVDEPTEMVHVKQVALDSYIHSQGTREVDFIKIDVEGGELEVLRGASNFLEKVPRPVILCEIQDVRTEPWGYRAKEIVAFLRGFGFRWFAVIENGMLRAMPEHLQDLDGNFVAVPEERLEQVRALFGQTAEAPDVQDMPLQIRPAERSRAV